MPLWRYKEDGRVLIRYRCGFCPREEIVEVIRASSLEEKRNERIDELGRFLTATRKIIESRYRNENDRVLKEIIGE